MASAAGRLGLRVAHEVFADRSYDSSGRLVPRQQTGAVVHDVDVVVARAVRMATDGTVVALDGSVLKLDAHTMCVHGDTPGAARLAAAVRQGLEAAGVIVAAIGGSQ
jgi:UPF0271 protein